MIKKIKDKLLATKKYSSASYAQPDMRADKHVHFELHISGDKFDEHLSWSMVSGYTLLVFPITFRANYDLDMKFLDGNVEISSAATSEKINTTVWLPLIVTAPFLNPFFTPKRSINHQLDYLISQIPG